MSSEIHIKNLVQEIVVVFLKHKLHVNKSICFLR